MSTPDTTLTRREVLQAGAALGALTVAGPARAAKRSPAMPQDEYARPEDRLTGSEP